MRLNTSKSIAAFFFMATCFLFVACQKEPCIPAYYEFDNVNYEGQTLRLDMTQQIKNFIDSAFIDQNGIPRSNPSIDQHVSECSESFC